MNTFRLLPFIILLALSFLACNKSPEVTPGDNMTFAEVISEGGTFPGTMTSEDTLSDGYEYETLSNGTIVRCNAKTVSAQKGAGGNSGYPLFNPNAEVIYPGGLIQGKTLGKGTPDIIPVKRSGGSIYIDIVNGSSNVNVDVNEVKRGTISQAMNSIIESNSNVIPSNFSFNYKDVYSREQMAIDMNVDVNTAFVDVESKLSFTSDKSYNRILVDMTQQFYTMGFDYPTSHEELFDPSVKPEDLGKYVQAGNPACYISSVTYGRLYYMLIESTSSLTTMRAQVNASFNTLMADGSVEVDAGGLSALDNLVIKVFALGGEAKSTTLTIGETNLSNLVGLLAEATDIRSGVPLSYVVRLADDPSSIVSTQLATQYDVVNCATTTFDPAPAIMTHWQGEILSKIGPVGAIENIGPSDQPKFIIFNQAGDKYVLSEGFELSEVYPVDSLGNSDEPFLLENVGAIGVRRVPFSWGETMELTFPVNAAGNLVLYGNQNDYWRFYNDGISHFPNDGHFNLEGYGAISYFRYTNSAGRILFNKEGTKYFNWIYWLRNGNNWDFSNNIIKTPYNLSQYGGGGCPLNAITGLAFFRIGSDRYTIMIAKDGLSYTIYHHDQGKFTGHYTL